MWYYFSYLILREVQKDLHETFWEILANRTLLPLDG